MQLTDEQIKAVSDWLKENENLAPFQLRNKFERDFYREQKHENKSFQTCNPSATQFSWKP